MPLVSFCTHWKHKKTSGLKEAVGKLETRKSGICAKQKKANRRKITVTSLYEWIESGSYEYNKNFPQKNLLNIVYKKAKKQIDHDNKFLTT